MGEIISESSVVESKMEGSTMNADELRLAQMGMSFHPQNQIDTVLLYANYWMSIRPYARVEAPFQYTITDRSCIYDDHLLDGSWVGYCH